MIERFARLNSIALLDTETGDQRELLTSADRSITNARVSPDGRWIAFEASPPGEPAAVFVARLEQQPVPEAAWAVVDRFASHPFWSADGRILYYMPTGTVPMVRSVIRGRSFVSESGALDASMPVYLLSELLMPAYLPGTAPLATPDQITQGGRQMFAGRLPRAGRPSTAQRAWSRSAGTKASTNHGADQRLGAARLGRGRGHES